MSDNKVRRLLYCSFGYTTHDHRFITAACSGGWEVSVVRFDGRTLELESRSLPGGAIRHKWLGDELKLNSDNRSAFVEAFEKVVSEVNPDVIQAGPLHNVADIAVAESRSAPVLATSWGSDLLLECEQSAESRNRTANVLASSDRILVDCETLADIAEKLGAERSHVAVIPWGVDLDQFPFSPKNQLDSPINLLSVRSLEPLYDVETLIRALPLISSSIGEEEVHLTIANDGSQRNFLSLLAQKLEVEKLITWLGRVSESEISDLLKKCDIYVSTSPIDGSSISLMQAIAVGRMCVVPNIPSNHEWVAEGSTGFFFRANDPYSLSNAVVRCYSDYSELARELQIVRANFVSRANWAINSSSYCALLTATSS